VAQPSEYGLYGTRTPGEIADDRRPDGDEEKSVLAERLDRAETQPTPERQSKDKERE
jgi:hypothetical protein